MLVVLLISCALVQYVASAPASAEITSLPGLDSKLSFKQYGGYITVNETTGKSLYYWFVESQNDPATDPLFIWLQGGPGCSSLFGFLTEHGPFKVNSNQTLALNPYSWTQSASIIYLDSPAGVGFSYSNSSSDYNTGDNQTMHDSYEFLMQWFELYPEFKKNDFYVSGESYGGHYVPQLAWTILNGNRANPSRSINIKGMLAGNAWTDDVIDTNSIPYFIYYHHLCSLPAFQGVIEACNLTSFADLAKSEIRSQIGARSSRFSDFLPRRWSVHSTEDACDKAYDQMFDEVGQDINQYDIYAPCLEGQGLDCSDYTPETTYLDTPAVQQAIHANKPQLGWEVCTTLINYGESWTSILPIYPELMRSMRVTVYAGDVTFNVPALGTEVWVEGLGVDVVSPYTAWMVNGQVAGYYKKFKGINYVTVKDSGHMVPYYTPEAGLVLFQKYLAKEF